MLNKTLNDEVWDTPDQRRVGIPVIHRKDYAFAARSSDFHILLDIGHRVCEGPNPDAELLVCTRARSQT